ncbi:enolase C-terminal domain-like protein [Pseudoponticoccus marisrubri]|uniref:Mandelate racemase n=1 Tax=Pseudoponticoccus marisrubri TaxID=1685382 RepID=A0A0W7WLW8_9RHOB|nr:enolase C-terminal domain-like protein [Pseudoponticoccus marisrubri]KUF11546.1 mandelate racemase [Pseudoponticoccus marisrubri]
MKIETITATRFTHSTNTVRDSDGHGHPGPESQTTSALLTITCEDGSAGHVICRPDEVREALLERYVRPNLVGQDPLCTEALWYKVYKWQRLSGGQLSDRTLNAVDLALWDLKGKLCGQPVWKLLGGARPKILAYGSTMCGDDLEDGLATPADYARFAEWMVRTRGYKAVKLHGWMPPMPGAPDPKKDYAACAAVREAVGPDVPLMLDPHHFYSRTDTLWLARKLATLDFRWMEEPMEEASMSSYIWLRQRSDLPILGPETMTGKHWTRAEWVRHDACDIVRAGVADMGGITPAMKAANMAESFHMSCEMHGTGAGNLAVALAIHNTSFYERGLLHPFIDYDTPKAYQNRIDDEMDAEGYVHGRDTPGLGQDLNLDYIAAHAV